MDNVRDIVVVIDKFILRILLYVKVVRLNFFFFLVIIVDFFRKLV